MRSLAESLGVRPTKQRGQNFVIDPNTVRRIVRAAGLSDTGETVLEVGPGLGSLTLALLAEGHRVTAVEIDPVLAEALPATIAKYAPNQADRLTVVEADAMHVLPAQIGTPEACVANLPYNVAVPVLLHLLAISPSLRHGLVMVQSEVADRLAAPPAPGRTAYRPPRPRGTPTSAAPGRSAGTCSGPPRTSTPAWSPSSAASHPPPRRPARTCSP